MKTTKIGWMNAVDQTEMTEAMEEACVDCYGSSEQWSGLFEMVGQELEFPFPARAMGENVQVVDTEPPDFDSLGLDLVIAHKKKHYAIAAHCVELLQPLPGGHPYLAAYLNWKSKQ